MQSLLPEDPKQVGDYTLLGRLGQGPRGIVYLGRLSGEARGEGQGDPAEAPETAKITGGAGNGEPEAAADPDEASPAAQTAPEAAAEAQGEPEPAASPQPASALQAAEPDRLFVVKLLPPWPEADPAARARVIDDLSAAQRVSSAYTARTVDAGWTGDRAYIVREHIEGRSLRETVQAGVPLTGDALERVAIGTLTALTAIHLAGIAHRALTPENVLLGPDGPRVADFGLGETSYLSPEQVRGEPSGPAADVFAWATTIAYAATGSELFGGSAEAIATARPDLGALPLPLRDVVASCLAKAVVERPTAQGAMLWLLGEEKSARPGPVLPPVPVGDPDRQTWVDVNGLDGQAPPPALVPNQPEGEGVAQVWAVPPQPQESPKLWGAPELPSAEAEPKAQPVSAGPAAAPGVPPRKKTGAHFPIGLAAGVGVVIGLSGLGLWGAGHYADTQQIGRVAAEGQVTSIPAPSGGVGSVGVPGGTTAPRPQVTVPWALSPGPQETGVYPLQLTTPSVSTGVPSLTPGPMFTPPPIPSSVPAPTATATRSSSATPAPTVTVTQTPTVTPSSEPTPSGPDTPTPDPSDTASPTPETTPSESSPAPAPSATRTAAPTRSATPPPVPRPTATKTVAPGPTATKTAAPKPTVTKTVVPTAVAPKPTASAPKPSTAPPKPPAPASNPYTPQKVCNSAGKGTGFYVQRSSAFSGGVTYQLYNASTGSNCVVTLKTTSIGKASPVSATLEVQGAGPMSDGGSFQYYAGPVIAEAKGKCVRFSGSAGGGSTSVPFANCG